MRATWRFGLSSFLASLALATNALAGVYTGAGYYVAVYSSYAVSGSMAKGFESTTYYGPIEGPFETEGSCNKRLKTIQSEFKSRPKRVGDGTALFMCMLLTEPMKDDSGTWWNPKRDD